ncbi:putative Tyrosinase copper-binding domain-containing protein [Seiridium cardinale]
MRVTVTAWTAIILALANLDTVFAACKNPVVRKEWRTLRPKEKKSYISAVKCLQKTPAKTQSTYAGVRSRFDDFQAEHINRTDFIHFVGFFQPWHRMYVAQYEAELRSTCGYTGAQPYWDWSADATSEDAFVNSPVFDAVNGFGGNGPYIDSSNDTSIRLHIPGKTGGGCILDGPFKNMSVNMGPGFNTSYSPHCLTRDLAPSFAIAHLNSTMVAYTLAATNYFEFDIRVEGGVDVPSMTYHGGGHLGVGGDLGEIGNVYSSPGDPLFYLHHANLDRLWYSWQKQDWQKRKLDIAGPDTQFAYPFNFFGDIPYNNVTLNFTMDFGPLMQNRKISEVMDPQAGALCYTYA